jgi:hypothetical protein
MVRRPRSRAHAVANTRLIDYASLPVPALGIQGDTGSPTIGYANPGHHTRSRHGATSFSMKLEEWIAT